MGSTGPGLLRRAILLFCLPVALTAGALYLPWSALEAFRADPSGARITDRDGIFLGVVPSTRGSFQILVGSRQIPAACAAYVVRLEDARFYEHLGVDPVAVARAAAARVLRRGPDSGASTISMQLARIVAPHARGFGGKLIEAGNAMRLETRLTKAEILAAYLDNVPFGRNTTGFGAAAWTYFGAELDSLSRAQLLALAIIPRNPTLYDPFDNPRRLIDEATALDARRAFGIGRPAIEAAVVAARSGRPTVQAPHFTRWVAGEIRAGRVRPADGTVRTSLDLGLTATIESRLRLVVSRYEEARVTNAAVVIIDNATEQIVAWVGSRDFGDAEHSGQIDGVLIHRQSASTLKPFLYAMAVARGWTAATLLPDVPLVFGSADEEAYRPENFDKRSHGAVRLRTALASSLNVPAVYTLSRVGVPDFLSTLRSLGFALSPDAAARWGLGSAIGNAEISLLELAHAFTVFPRGGTIGDLQYQAHTRGAERRMFDPFTSWLICNMLSDPSARAAGFGTHTYFRTSFPAMFKTGTSSEFTNLWCVGATPQYTVAAWAGNFDGRAVINKTGSIIPTQIVVDALELLSTSQRVSPSHRDFPRPAGVVSERICSETGLRATAGCTATRVEYFRSQAEIPRPDTGAHDDDRALLRDAFLAPSEEVRILFPAMGQVVYLDATLREGLQRLPVVVASRGPLRLSMDGERIALDTRFERGGVPIARGTHTIVAATDHGSDRVVFDVR